jgi:hypothetical protein
MDLGRKSCFRETSVAQEGTDKRMKNILIFQFRRIEVGVVSA